MAPTARRLLRVGFGRRLSRLGLWIGIPLLLSGGVLGGAQLSRFPAAQSALQSAVDKMVEGTGLLGFTVSDVTVEGRETTDRDGPFGGMNRMKAMRHLRGYGRV